MEEVMDELELEEVEEEDIRRGKYMTFQVEQDVFGIELKYVNEIIQMQPVTPIPEVEHFIKGLMWRTVLVRNPHLIMTEPVLLS